MTPKEELIRVLEIRQELGKSAVKKYDTVVKMRCEDGKIRGMMGFYGANRTGRYCFAAGTLVQSQENGLVPIESISSEDLVWDGKNFVSCDGAVCNGFRPVGILRGIRVTPDHFLKNSFNTHRWRRADEYKEFEILPETTLVYDIQNCGKNHCYAVYSENERQQFIAHNCSHGVQLQNLKRTHVPSLNFSRSLVKDENEPALRLCYGNVADTLGQLVRTALVPSPGNKFFDADYAQVEARVIAWLAGENWRLDLFKSGGDIYCESASKIYGVPVKKGGINGDLRQRGKVAELACIAEHQKVLTDRGYVPIEKIKNTDKIFDGKVFASHEGLVYNGVKEVIQYEGITATPDHLVWVEGKDNPIHFGEAAESGSCLYRPFPSWKNIWTCRDNQPKTSLHPRMGGGLCANEMLRLWKCTLDVSIQSTIWKIKGLSKVLSKKNSPGVAIQKNYRGKSEMLQFGGKRVPSLWRSWNQILFFIRKRSLPVCDGKSWTAQRIRARQDRQQRKLRPRKYSICDKNGKSKEQRVNASSRIRPKILAIRGEHCSEKIIGGENKGTDNIRSKAGGSEKSKELEGNKKFARVYDIRNVGSEHCYTVSGALVHNCGYGGGVGAMRRMDTVHALDDKPDEEVKTIVDQWRVASPNIINLWHDLESAAMKSVRYGTENTVVKPNCKIIFRGETDGKRRFLTVELPSGRKLFYPEPRIGTNRFGSESITYMGQNQLSKKWERVDTYGGKLTENITQAVARDLLCHSIELLEFNGFPVVFSIHDEVVVDYPDGGSDEANEKILEKIVEVMRILPDWAKGCPIDADGWYDDYFRKE